MKKLFLAATLLFAFGVQAQYQPPPAAASGLSIGNSVFLDAVNGSNSTGTRGQAGKPFLTAAAAETAASSGDVIQVFPGTYEAANLHKTGITWNLAGGATLQNTSDSSHGVFDDTANAMVGSVTGFGTVKQTTGIASSTIKFTNASTNFAVTCDAVYNTAGGEAFHSELATSYLKARYVFASNGSSQGTGLWWRSGECYTEVQQIDSYGICIYANEGASSSTGNWWVVGLARATSQNYSAVQTLCDTGAPACKVWIIGAGYLGSAGVSPVQADVIVHRSAKLYMIGIGKIESVAATNQKIFSVAAQATDFWLTAQKATSNSGNTADLFDAVAGTNDIEVLRWEVLNSPTETLKLRGGTNTIRGGRLVTSSGDGIVVTGGTAVVQGMTVSASGGTDLKQTGGSLSVSGSNYSTTVGTITQGDPFAAQGVALVTKTTNYTVTNSDHYILVDSTSGPVTITLPSAVGLDAKERVIKDWKGTSAMNAITIATTSSQTIDGATNFVLSSNYTALSIVPDGANWSIK